jgi:5-methylcytosine-specific restriction endonuclease McrA
MTNSLQEIIDRLQAAFTELIHAGAIDNIHQDDDDPTTAAYIAILELCDDVERQINHVKRIAERQRNAIIRTAPTTRQMTGFIIREIDRKERTVRKAADISGGAKAKALRLAGGKCELCGQEFGVSVHDIIPRAKGGLPEAENYIVLCNACHDDVEDQGYHTREEVLRHVGRHVPIRNHPEPQPKAEPTRSEKAAVTRAMNQVAQQREEMELVEWDQWSAMFSRAVGYLQLGDPQPPRPEKTWHVYVYGAGRHSKIARE